MECRPGHWWQLRAELIEPVVLLHCVLLSLWSRSRMADELNIAATFEEAEALSPDELLQKIVSIREDFPEDKHPLFLLFTGSKSKREEGEGGGLVSWCPDCTRAAPVVFATLEEFSPESVLLILNCERAEYKDQAFTYRENPSIKLTSVPTLISWQDGQGVTARLGDAESQNAQLVKALVVNATAASEK